MERREEFPEADSSQSGSYVLVSGNGRSGSNRLLDIFDASRRTVCRNEVNNTAGSQFHGIGGTLFEEDLDPQQLAALRAALRRARIRRSARDRLDQSDKSFLNTVGRMLLKPASRGSVRRALSAVGLMAHEGEWALPAIGLDAAALPQARLVLKLNACPGWAAVLAAGDPGCRIVHNIRDPRAYLQSWHNRFVRNGFGTRSFEEAFGDVPRILAHFGRDGAERLRAPTEENLVEVELWRWRFINEGLLALASLPGRYLLTTYAEIEADAAAAARRLYDFAGIPLERAAEARIGSMRNTLFAKPHRTALDAGLCERLVGAILEDSPLKEIEALKLR